MILHLKRTRNNWIIFQSNDYCDSSESDGGTKIATPGEIDYQELRTDVCQICQKIAMKYYRRTTMNQSHFFGNSIKLGGTSININLTINIVCLGFHAPEYENIALSISFLASYENLCASQYPAAV